MRRTDHNTDIYLLSSTGQRNAKTYNFDIIDMKSINKHIDPVITIKEKINIQ